MRRSSVCRSTTRPRSTGWVSVATEDDRRAETLSVGDTSEGLVRSGGTQFSTGADAELGEDLAQMPFDGARAQEQPCRDIWIGQAVAGEPCDLRFLLRQCVARLPGPLAYLLPGGEALPPGALGERFHAH